MSEQELAALVWHTEKRRVSELVPWEANPRQITAVMAKKLQESLQHFNLVELPVIDVDNRLVAGHMRMYAMKALGRGEEEIEVRVPNRKLTEDEFARYNLTSNKTTGEWDWEALAAFDPNILRDVGFSELELVDHFNLDEKDVGEDNFDPEAAGEPELPISVGDRFVLGNHIVMCGDATNPGHVAELMGEDRAAMVFTDPPYNVDYKGGVGESEREGIMNDKMTDGQFRAFLLAALKNMMTFTDGAFYVFMSSSELVNLKAAFEEAGGHYQSLIIWAKQTFTLSRTDYQQQFEPALYGWKEGVVNHYFIGTRKESNIWDDLKAPNVKFEDGHTIIKMGERWLRLEGEVKGQICDKDGQVDLWHEDKPTKSKDHPTMKPLRRVARAVRNSSLPREIVMDLFGGSGSTLIACETMARACRTMELDPKYVNVIIKRWESHTGRKAEKLAQGAKPSFFAKTS